MSKPCPFCKRKKLETQQGTPDREGTPVNIICSACGARGPWIYWVNMDTFETAPIEAIAAMTGWDDQKQVAEILADYKKQGKLVCSQGIQIMEHLDTIEELKTAIEEMARMSGLPKEKKDGD
jgi:hypothetical protein